MVYHEVREIKGRILNYLVYNIRAGRKWKKKTKFLGEGKLSAKEVENGKRKFEKEIKLQKCKYLSAKQLGIIEEIKEKFEKYLKKAGKLGIEKFKEWFSTELTYNSNAIEGSSLSLAETSLIINENIAPKGASLREIHEAKNHRDAITFLENYKRELNEKFILKLHSFILKNISEREAGRCRRVSVKVRGTDFKFPQPLKVPLLMKELVKWYKENKGKLHPLELAIIISMKLVTIHPFIDGNGRVSRLIMNFLLKKSLYPEINIYMKDRQKYLDYVSEANKENYKPIIDFVVKTVKKNYSFLYGHKF